MEFFRAGSTNINFIGQKNICFVISGVFISIGILGMILPIYPNRHFGLNLSIDFVGGTVVQFQFDKPVVQDLGTIRKIINSLNYGSPSVKTIGTEADREVQVVVKSKDDINIVSDDIQRALHEHYADNPFQVRRQEKIGPKVGNELAGKAVMSLLLSFAAICIYVAFRFNLPFGVAAILSIIHDVMVVVTVWVVFNIEFSLQTIAALLTIAGYSINDTIVIYDRVRENLTSGATAKMSFNDRVNRSINQTLSRTINTVLTVFMVVVSIFIIFYGTGDVLGEFSLAMIVGLITGTYSSIYVGTALACVWNERWPIKSTTRG